MRGHTVIGSLEIYKEMNLKKKKKKGDEIFCFKQMFHFDISSNFCCFYKKINLRKIGSKPKVTNTGIEACTFRKNINIERE
jgi:hypothetical protein